MIHNLYQLTPVGIDVEEFLKEHRFLSKVGGFNEWPEPHEEITAEEALSWMTGVMPNYWETRYIPEIKLYVYIGWFHTRGIGIAQNVVSYPIGSNNLKPARFFRFGCKHKWEAHKQGQWTDAECKLCGMSEVWDSSD